MPTATEPPAPVVDQVTAAYLERAGSATARATHCLVCGRKLNSYNQSGECGPCAHERVRLLLYG